VAQDRLVVSLLSHRCRPVAAAASRLLSAIITSTAGPGSDSNLQLLRDMQVRAPRLAPHGRLSFQPRAPVVVLQTRFPTRLQRISWRVRAQLVKSSGGGAQVAALADGAVLRHLRAALFEPGEEDRAVARRMSALWLHGCAPAQRALARALPAGLLAKLLPPESPPVAPPPPDAAARGVGGGGGGGGGVAGAEAPDAGAGAERRWGLLFTRLSDDHVGVDMRWDARARGELRGVRARPRRSPAARACCVCCPPSSALHFEC